MIVNCENLVQAGGNTVKFVLIHASMRKARNNIFNFRRRLAIYLMDSTNRIFFSSANIDGTKSHTRNNSQIFIS